jgi:hypothetical protein
MCRPALTADDVPNPMFAAWFAYISFTAAASFFAHRADAALLAIADRACLLNDFALAMPPLLAFAMLTNITRKHSAASVYASLRPL